MSEERLGVAQIGCGAFAEGADLPNFTNNPHTDVLWCCDISEQRAKEMATKFSVPNVTTDYLEAINDPAVGMIKIATTHEVHLPIIEAAAAAGKHIFCEKPMAMEEEEAYKIIRAVKHGGVKLCVGLNRRMAPSMQALRKAWQDHVENPKHQPWRYIEVEREELPEERQTQFLIRAQDESASYRMVHLDPLRGGGLIIGETVHWLDLACWFFAPQVPIRIQAWGSMRLSHGINLSFSGGDMATILFSCGGTFDFPKELYEVTSHRALFRNQFFVENNYFGVPGLDREVFPFVTDDGPVSGEDGGFSEYLRRYSELVRGRGDAKGAHAHLAIDKGHRAMADAFVDAVLNDLPSPCDEFAGLSSTYLAGLARKSVELGQSIAVPIDGIRPAMA